VVKLLIVGAGGFLGAVARYGLSGLVHRLAGAGFPWGTLAVNVVGCLLIGGLMVWGEDRPMLSPTARLFLTVGLMGAFTTFSTFGYETLELLRDRQATLAGVNVAANVLLGLAAVWAGRALCRVAGL